jgi:hypothetical protein
MFEGRYETAAQAAQEKVMPAAFERCRAKGGKIYTIVPKKGTYIHVCKIGGKSYSGEVKHTQASNKHYVKG